jgi:ring-1,2-phenylacetyl-CoA epoxidase subunit PaaE
MLPGYHTLTIDRIVEEVKGFRRFVFKEGHNIQYKAGQYLTLVHIEKDSEVRRSYSITSSPFLNEPLSIGVKRIENGFFSRQLIDHAQPGDKLLSSGAGGFFVLPDEIQNYTRTVFFAAGSGITPVFSLIKTILHQYPHIQVALVYSNPSPSKAVFLDDLNDLQGKFASSFKTEFLFSNNANLLRARLHRDLLIHFISKYAGAGKNTTLFYTCGPEAYMRMVLYTLHEAGFPRETLKKEHFVIQRTKSAKAIPPDTGPHQVTVKGGNQNLQFTCQYPDTILSAAKKAGINLPYSCELGRCGNCAARCVEGSVWLSYNEVLTDMDLVKGLTLTCVGYPINGDVVLEV